MLRVISLLVASLAVPSIAAAHAGHGAPQPWDACADQARAAACSWTDARSRLYVGTCRPINGGMMCVRNRPIVTLPPPAAMGALAGLAGWVSPLAVRSTMVHTRAH